MKSRSPRLILFLLCLLLLLSPCLAEQPGSSDPSAQTETAHAETISPSEETVLAPVLPTPPDVALLLQTAAGEVGYREGEHGRTKYGEWAGDPYCQWCAEFLCWCVSETDRLYGTAMAANTYPIWSASNVGRAWFVKAGRFAVRSGEVEGWGYEWLRGESEYLRTGSYIPQPGDYVFFTWTGGTDTDHVAMVEYCTADSAGAVTIHVIEGNNPVAVARNTYSLTDNRILGYGTVHDLVDITMRFGNEGEKVRQLQEKLSYLEYLDPQHITGHFGRATSEALNRFQQEHDLRPNAIANQKTQLLLDEAVDARRFADPDLWRVVDED